MKLLRCTLKKERQEIVLQGMVHIADSKMYFWVKEDINQKAEEGFQIFYEGVVFDELPPEASEQEQQIAKYFNLLFSLIPELVSAYGISYQGEEIKYPDNAINADIKFPEMVRKLAENGFADSLFMRRLAVHMERDEKFGEGLKNFFNKVYRIIPFATLLSFVKKTGFLFGKIISKKEDEVLLGYRNEVIIDIITKDPSEKKIGYYGEAHLRGMIQLLQERGWELVSSIKVKV